MARAVRERIEAIVEDKNSMKAQRRLAREYERTCGEHGVTAYPPGYNSVSIFVSELVRIRQGSSKTLGAALTAVKVASGELGHGWLAPPELLKLGRLVKQFEYEDPFQVRRKHGLQLKHLLPWLESMDLEDVFQLEEATIIMLGHDGLLRSGELLGGLKVKDVVWAEDKEDLSIWLRRSKANRSGSGELVTVPRYGDNCAVELMKRWFVSMNYWNEDKADCYFFPGRKRGGRGFNHGATISLSWLRVRVKKLAIYLGLKPEEFSRHSLRAGGGHRFVC